MARPTHSNNTRQGFIFEPSRSFGEDGENDVDELVSSSDEEQSSRTENLLWCICGQCWLMPSIVESVCCQEDDVFGAKMDSEHQCIAETEAFRKACLDPLILEILMASLKEVVGEDLRDPISNRLYRYTAYRSFTWWVYGKLGKRRRKVIPSCAVMAIRGRFPEENGAYEGFHTVLSGDTIDMPDEE